MSAAWMDAMPFAVPAAGMAGALVLSAVLALADRRRERRERERR
jgi:hypothetical protein